MDINPQRQRDLELAVYQLECILSPARNSPADIWREIFCRCLSASSRPGLNFSVAPLLLTHVCPGWKSIAIATPQLWNSIHVDIPIYQIPTGLPHESLQKRPDWRKLNWKGRILNDWLDRSGVLPLFVTLSAQDLTADYQISESTFHFIHRLGCYSPRLYSLELSISRSHDLYHHFMTLHAFGLTNLNEIIVDEVPVNIMRGTNAISWIDADVFRVPQLRKISIGDLPTGTSSWTMTIPSNWQSLQYLHIGTPLRPRSVLQVLVTLHDLIECSLGIAYSREVLNHTTLILLPKSTSLSLVDEIGWKGTSLFLYQYLDAPVLRSLKFSAKLLQAKKLWLTTNPILILLPRIRHSINWSWIFRSCCTATGVWGHSRLSHLSGTWCSLCHPDRDRVRKPTQRSTIPYWS